MTIPQSNTISVHKPVMVSEVMSNLIKDSNGIYIDGTVGLGGHAKEILSLLSKEGHLIGVDRDKYALEQANKYLKDYGAQVDLVQNSFSNIDQILVKMNIKEVNGILLDLGLSSAQLADRNRGFSFSEDGELDMRFDIDSGLPVKDFIKSVSENELADIIWNFGEERHSRRIAQNIKAAQKMETVNDLREAIRRSTPPNNRNKSFARVFQSLRIVVNDELQHLGLFLDKFIRFLKPGGHIVIISYHSLEDRLVKFTFKRYRSEALLSILTKKPLIPSDSEIELNSRSRSAKMRIGERIK